MSYLVLARKYRPQTFAEVIGQTHITRTLCNAITRGKVHHAFLFCGSRGTGKTTCARILAKALSCEMNSSDMPEPCNMCRSCAAVNMSTSPDVIEIDAASQNSVEDIRKLRETVRYAPIYGKKKLYILDEVHMLSAAAFNAALKMLEEPPPYAVFVFATTDPQKVPVTILTRVQRYDFKLVRTGVLADHLAQVLTLEKIAYEYDAVKSIAREGGGSVRDSLSLLDQILAALGPGETLTATQVASMIGTADRGLITDLCRAILNKDPTAILTAIELAYDRSYDMSLLSRAIASYVRDLTILILTPGSGGDRYLDATSDEIGAFRTLIRDSITNWPAAKYPDLFAQTTNLADQTARASMPRHTLEIGLCGLCL